MITPMKLGSQGFEPAADSDTPIWVHTIDPSPIEQARLIDEYKVDPDMLTDILDIDELARIEKEADGQSSIIRIPIFDPDRDVPYFTVPFGIIMRANIVITVCLFDNPISQDILRQRIRGLDIENANSLILNTILRSSVYFHRYLKNLNRKITVIERDLHSSVRNVELLDLMRAQRSLTFFSASLRTNDLLLEKIHKLSAWPLDADEQELLEDTRIEIKQANEMARIYANNTDDLMDAFSTVTSNNQNTLIKKLTVISVVFMPLNILAGMGGMSEYSVMTEGVSKLVSYSLFSVGLVIVGWLTYLIITRYTSNDKPSDPVTRFFQRRTKAASPHARLRKPPRQVSLHKSSGELGIQP
jgi:magnesium transporter